MGSFKLRNSFHLQSFWGVNLLPFFPRNCFMRSQVCRTALIRSLLEIAALGVSNGGSDVRIRPLGADLVTKIIGFTQNLKLIDLGGTSESPKSALNGRIPTSEPPLEAPGSVLFSALWIRAVRHNWEPEENFSPKSNKTVDLTNKNVTGVISWLCENTVELWDRTFLFCAKICSGEIAVTYRSAKLFEGNHAQDFEKLKKNQNYKIQNGQSSQWYRCKRVPKKYFMALI